MEIRHRDAELVLQTECPRQAVLTTWMHLSRLPTRDEAVVCQLL